MIPTKDVLPMSNDTVSMSHPNIQAIVQGLSVDDQDHLADALEAALEALPATPGANDAGLRKRFAGTACALRG